MKVGKVRMGEKFVLDDRGGVWEKVGDNPNGTVQGRCFFGPRGLYGSTVDLDPRAYCYVIFTRPVEDAAEAAVKQAEAAKQAERMRIRLIDGDTETLVLDIPNASPSQISALSSVDVLRLTPPGKRLVKVYHVSEYGFDMDEGTLYVEVLGQEIGGRDEEDDGGPSRNTGSQSPRRDATAPTQGPKRRGPETNHGNSQGTGSGKVSGDSQTQG